MLARGECLGILIVIMYGKIHNIPTFIMRNKNGNVILNIISYVTYEWKFFSANIYTTKKKQEERYESGCSD